MLAALLVVIGLLFVIAPVDLRMSWLNCALWFGDLFFLIVDN